MKYNEPKPGEWVQPVRKGYRMMCCDCSLVHKIDFRLMPYGSGQKIQFRVFRHERATAAARRKRKKK